MNREQEGVLLKKKVFNQKKSIYQGIIIFSIIMFFFFFFVFTGRKLAEEGNIIWSARYAIKLIALCIFCGVFSGFLLTLLFLRMSNFGTKRGIRFFVSEERKSKKRYFFISLGLTFFSWIPCYLAYYPAICSYDITIQMEQIISGKYLDHHPLAHTLLIQFFMDIGSRFLGSVNSGIALYAICQMLLLAISFATGIYLLYRNGLSKFWLILMQIYASFFLLHWFVSISMTKDSIFTAFFYLQLLCLCVLIKKNQDNPQKISKKWTIAFFISTVLMMFFRNNGKYAFMVFLVCLLIPIVFSKPNRLFWGKLFLISGGALVTATILLTLLFQGIDAQQGDKREMLSMPIQQLARCMIYHGGVGVLEEDDNTMAQENKDLINDFILDKAYTQYRPDIADPVKRHTYTYVVRYRTIEFAQTYLHLFIQYPGEFINAALTVNAGYLYPYDETHATINYNNRDKGLGYIQTRWVEAELNPVGIYKDSKWQGLFELLDEFADKNAYLNIPIIKYLFMPGWYLWFYALLVGYQLWKKKYANLAIFALIGGYYATLLLGPTVQLRYLYPVMVSLPFLMFWMTNLKKSESL